MHFDDRLDTVLRLPATGRVFPRIQFRQLLDILGSIPGDAQSHQIEAAYRRLAELSEVIPAGERARMVGAPLSRLRSRRLLAELAEAEPSVASAAIGAAQISEADWLALIPALPVRARGILRHRRGLGPRVERLLARLGIDDLGLPPAERDGWSATAPADDDEPLELVDVVPPDEPTGDLRHARPAPGEASESKRSADHGSDISELLRRIEEFSRARRRGLETSAGGTDAPRLPLEDQEDEAGIERTVSFDFATDPDGRIVWSDARTAPMVVGLRFAAPRHEGALTAPTEIAPAMRRHQPLRGVAASISGAPAVAGEWRIDAAPCFDPELGRFTGYTGRFRRPPTAPAGEQVPDQARGEADRIRQIIHELRTPANAIQIAAEIIQQNLFGPTPHEYRAIAAMIASDTAYVLAGFDELERLAKLEGKAIGIERGTSDIAAVTATIVEQLQAYTEKRDSGFVLETPDAPVEVGLAEAEAERLVWRLLAALASESAPGERLALSLAAGGGRGVLGVTLPAALASRDDDRLFRSTVASGSLPRALSAGMFGTGFSLRLARAEARAAGGSLKRDGNHLWLGLPAPTAHREAV